MSSEQPTNFHRFLELPFEIRWIVYELCLPIRVIDGEISDLIFGKTAAMTREEGTAFKHIFARFSRTPIIARASPEVYRKLQVHAVRPPGGEWVWSWIHHDLEGFTDSRPIIFDPRSDVLGFELTVSSRFGKKHDYLDGKTPSYLSKNKDAVMTIDAKNIFYCLSWPEYAKLCFENRKKCVVILDETRLIESAECIASCGLFGLFGEERTVLVDVHDFKQIDYFDEKLSGQGMVEHYPVRGTGHGIRRYSSHSNVGIQTTTCQERSPLVSTEKRTKIIEEDKRRMTREIQMSWLMANDPSVDYSYRRKWYRMIDEENPKVKFWLDKLPVFTFAVRVHAQDHQDYARLTSAREARRRLIREQAVVV